MTEEFLQYLWKNQLFPSRAHTLTNGESMEVIHPGELNRDAGPDFFNARLRINETIWAGNVEIHTRASDWHRHGHQNQEGYNNTILHVVGENDAKITNARQQSIPTLELKGIEELHERYHSLTNSPEWLPCRSYLSQIDDFFINNWKEALLIERMQQKSEEIFALYHQNENQLEETFYQLIAANFGFKVNREPFLMLALATPLKILAKQKNDLTAIEAILFGQSALLPEVAFDDYTHQLKNDYQHFRIKYNLIALEKHQWKFARLRPGNFPSIRLAQFASLVFHSSGLWGKISDSYALNQVKDLLNVSASAWWDNHYLFTEEESRTQKKHLGAQSVDNLIINTLIPFLFFYARLQNNPVYQERALDWISQLKPESNHIITQWEENGLKASTAFDTQALIQLKNHYCKSQRCLHCRIGHKVIRHVVR